MNNKLKSPSVFLSYSHYDRNHKRIQKLINDLKNKSKINLWIDTERINQGDSIVDLIEKGISTTDYFIYLITENSVKSHWLRHEYFLALSTQLRHKNLRLILVLIDVDAKIPLDLRNQLYIDLSKNYDVGYSKIIDIINPPIKNKIITFDIDNNISGETIIDVTSTLNKKLFSLFLKKPNLLKSINRTNFEEIIADLFKGFGYEVELTKKTRDGGRDVVAIKSSEVNTKYLIECKRPDIGNKIGIKPVRELYGVKQDEQATKAILATTIIFHVMH